MTKQHKKNVKRKKAGHRSWAARNAPIPGGHHGDIMSAEKRSALMSRIKGKGTGPEKAIMSTLRAKGICFTPHARDLPGHPDIVFRKIKLAVFIDGDFWHGWRFPLWKHKLSAKWQTKIASNRERDQRNFRKLRYMGWRVVRIWEHQVEENPAACLKRVISAMRKLS